MPLNIYNDVGASYQPGATLRIFSTVINSTGRLVNATVNITIYEPDGSLENSSLSTLQTTGRYSYSYVLPSTEGTYRIEIDANYSGDEIHDSLAFTVSTAAGGGGGNATVPEVIVDAPAAININTLFDIIALTKSSSGLAADCSTDASITIRNTLNGTNVVTSAPMTKFDTGLYNYTWSTSVQSTYLAIVKCTILAVEYTGIKEFSNQDIAGGTTSTGAEIIVDAPAVINTNTKFDIISLARSSTGTPVNCDGEVTSSNGTFVDDLQANWTAGTFINTSTNSSAGYGNITLNQTSGNYSLNGTFTSQVFNAGNAASWINLTWNSNQPAGTNISIDVRSCSQSDCSDGAWSNNISYSSPLILNTTITPNNRYFQYKAALRTNDTNVTPHLEWINISYSILRYSLDGTFTSQVFNAGNAASWINLTWNSNEPAGTNISIDVRSCSQSDCSDGIWSNNISYSSPLILNATITPNSRYFQYKAALRTNDTNVTPHLEWINISYLTLAVSGANISIRNTLNGTNVVNNAEMTKFDTGLYNYTWSTNAQSTYAAIVKCTILAVEYNGMKVFSTQNVSSAGGGGTGGTTGGLPLNMFSTVGSFYSPSDMITVYATTTNSNGTLVSATVNNSVYYPNGTLLTRGLSTATTTGVFNFSFTLPSSAYVGTYSVRIDANYSGNEIHDILSFIVSSSLEQIKNQVTNLTTYLHEINQTTYNISYFLSNTIYQKLNDANDTIYNVLARWGMYNATTIYDLTNQTNSKVTDIYNDTQALLLKWGSYTAAQLFNISNLTYYQMATASSLNNTWNNTLAMLDLIGRPTDTSADNTLFGEFKYTQSTILNVENNLTTILTGINLTTYQINSTVNSILVYVNNLSNMHQCRLSPNTTICSLLNSISEDVNSISVSVSIPEDFEIDSLAAVSPRYASENVVIEATFSNNSGVAITPDTINLTIYDPNNNRWTNATKTNFVQWGDIWRYTQSLGSGPTTGMYTAHLAASYKSMSSSGSIQFRVATGGPYSVYIDCPASSQVGTDLACTVILRDEGEHATESTCEFWVDTDSDGIEDSNEPQWSKSEETTAGQNETYSTNINVPSSHPTGLYVVRADCSYANSAQPNSGASDSVVFTTAAPPPAPPAPVTEEAAPSAGKRIVVVECNELWECSDWSICIDSIQSRSCIDSNKCGTKVNKPAETRACEVQIGQIQITDYPEFIEVNVNEGTTEELTITNVGEDVLHDVKLRISGLPSDMYKISPKTININPGEQQVFTIEIMPSSEEKTYQITFIVTAKEGSEEAHSMLTVSKPIKPEVVYPSPVKIISHPIFIAIIILLIISLMIIKRKAIKRVIRGLLEDSYKERLEKKEEEVKEEKLKKEIEEKKKKEEDFKAKLTITLDDLKGKEKEKPENKKKEEKSKGFKEFLDYTLKELRKGKKEGVKKRKLPWLMVLLISLVSLTLFITNYSGITGFVLKEQQQTNPYINLITFISLVIIILAIIKIKQRGGNAEKLKKQIQLAKQYKEQIKSYYAELDKKYESGEISKGELQEYYERGLDGKGFNEWMRRYNDYISYYQQQIREREENQEAPNALPWFIILIFLLPFVWFAVQHTGITGLVSIEQQHISLPQSIIIIILLPIMVLAIIKIKRLREILNDSLEELKKKKKERKNEELKKKIQAAQQYKEQIRAYYAELNQQYKSGEISAEQLRDYYEGGLDGKGFNEWMQLYDNYINRYQQQIQEEYNIKNGKIKID